MKRQPYDNRAELIKTLPNFKEAFNELKAPASADHYVASAALVRGYLNIIRSPHTNRFPPEPETASDKSQRKQYARDYRERLLNSNPGLNRETKVATLHFCHAQPSGPRIVEFLAESTYQPSNSNSGGREWYSQSQFGLLTYTEGPVATHVMSGRIGDYVCSPLFSLAAFREDISRLRTWAAPGIKAPAHQISYLLELAIDSLDKGPNMRKVEPHSVGELEVISYSESDCLIRLGTNDFRIFDVEMSLCNKTWRVGATATQRS